LVQVRTTLFGTFLAANAMICLATGGISVVDAAERAQFVPNSALGFDEIVKSVSRAPEIVASVRDVRMRTAALEQSRLWNNPVLDATWSSIPIGRTNPTHLERPLANVPNYRVGVSYTFPIGKRGPLQAARAAEVEAAKANACAVSRQLAIDLAQIVGSLAITELRIEAFRRLLEAAKDQEHQVQLRAKQQVASGLEVDRAAIERGRLEQQLRAFESDLSEQRAACSVRTGLVCERFATAQEATKFLENWVNVDLDAMLKLTTKYERPDIRTLSEATIAARHNQTYFERQRIPDPTVRLGYIHDQFWISGAQPNALELSVAVPMPIFDWGQASSRAARAAAESFDAERSALLQTSQAVLPSLRERLIAQRMRRASLTEELIPRAQSVLNDVVSAYETKLLSMNDVIQARRALLELILESIDGLSDAYAAVLGVRAQVAMSEKEGCPS
jgi:cobalt-zinc-cadmium efflux system outer membrane protein